jgi:hypothetical protein
VNLTPTTYVQIEGDTVHYNVTNLAEAKIALKELKLKKKELGLLKREVAARQKEIRTAYTNEVRQRGSMFRGGGGLGKLVRAMQSASRDSKRAALANDLAPLENQKSRIDSMIGTIDYLIVRLEADMLNSRRG